VEQADADGVGRAQALVAVGQLVRQRAQRPRPQYPDAEPRAPLRHRRRAVQKALGPDERHARRLDAAGHRVDRDRGAERRAAEDRLASYDLFYELVHLLPLGRDAHAVLRLRQAPAHHVDGVGGHAARLELRNESPVLKKRTIEAVQQHERRRALFRGARAHEGCI